ncbi:hypothetical protein O7602_28960 [Micromonospora sp. WMMD1128]|uniref:hypothetical protein n=1 Tax=Micromonospora sp. WMMD1128 TaxID=3015150 RepID=UPI00248CB87E|nr:hypothetical protein [Micromonospora sp. WMMD1128]WBB73645.1 hypothetical protein O7602_28960 [Micromonospora sp. WMMD1128]
MPDRNPLRTGGRNLLAATLSMMVAAGTVVATAAPAAAYDVRYETSTAWGWTDSKTPGKNNLNRPGDLPVGTWKDAKGHPHTSRAYLTFDISRYRGADIERAVLDVKETAGADCTKRPKIELWRTSPYTAKSSWRKPPADLGLVDNRQLTNQTVCPAPRVEFDASEGLRQALAEGRSTLTLSLRLPADAEQDPTLARRYAVKAGISIDYNFRPGVPTELETTAGTACTTAEPYQVVRSPTLSGVVHDRDRNDTGGTDQLTALFAAWPVDQPDARVEQTDYARDGERAVGRFDQMWPVPFEHDRTYAWRMRSADSRATGDWSPICYFRYDVRGPATPPTVTSTDFPDDYELHPGLPGAFTFTANGATDVVTYGYSLNYGSEKTVDADRPGGSATVTLTPGRLGNTLRVWSLDAVGNRSATTDYTFFAEDVSPIVDGRLDEIGVPATFQVRSQLDGVVRYRYGLDGDPERTVDAAADGTAAFTVTATRGGNRTLSVTGVTAAGVEVTATREFSLPTEPKISATVYEEYGVGGGQGVPGVFTFTPRVPDTVSYRYHFNGEEGTVRANADGTASITWTPTAAGWVDLGVWGVSRDGTESEPATWFFQVRDLLPGVYSSLYWPDQWAGGPGQAGEFRLSSEVPDTVAYRYRFDGGAEQSVDADANGYATVGWTPEQGGTHTLTVRGVTLDGTVSAERTYTFLVNDAPLVSSEQYPKETNSGLPGVAGVFTVTPQRPGMVKYHYTFWGEETKTVDAAADGTASIIWTPETSGWRQLTVIGETADGTSTQPREYTFSVREPKPTIVSYLYNEYDPQGGIGVAGAFRFDSELPDTIAFVYRLNGGPEQTVAVTDGTAAELTITPDRGFRNTLTVRARSAAGELSPEASYSFVVSTAPAISSTTYPYGEPGGGVGVPGVFTFTPGMPDVESYVYQFDNGPEITVPAGADGSASVTLTPTEARWYPISVFAIDKAGNRSNYAYHWFVVQG